MPGRVNNKTLPLCTHPMTQVLITFTSMFIDQAVIKTQPKVFESFIDALLDTVSKVNSGPDRLLRATVLLPQNWQREANLLIGLPVLARI